MATLNRNLHRRQQSCRMVPPALFLYTLRETRAPDAAALLELILRARKRKTIIIDGKTKERARTRTLARTPLGWDADGKSQALGFLKLQDD